MKRMLLLLVAFAIIGSLFAQEKVKQKELGLVFESFNSFGIMYKFGHQKSMWRLKTLYGSGQNSESSATDAEYNNKRYYIGLAFGKQFSKPITDKLDLIYGIDLKYSYFYSYDLRVSSEDYQSANTERMEYYHAPGLNLVLGFNYIIHESIIIGVELLPGFSYAMGKRTESYSDYPENDMEFDNTQFNFNISSSSAMVSLAYRF